MKHIFLRGPSFLLRISIAIALAFVLILADSKFNLFSSSRIYLNSFVSPVQYVADAPQKLFSAMSDNLMTRQALKVRNNQLVKENLTA